MPENVRVNIDPAEALAAAAAAEAAAKGTSIDKKNADPAALPSDNEGTPPADKKADDGRPENIPEKFWKDGKLDTEALLASYSHLEKKQGGEPTPKPGEKTDGKTNDLKVPESAEVAAAVDVVAKAGLKFEVLNETYAKDGKLADADYAALEKQGIPKAMVDSFIAGQIALAQATADATSKAAHDAAGGAEKYAEAIQWAAKNLDKSQIEAFNKTIDGNNAAAIGLAVTGLVASMAKAGGNEPENLNGGSGGQGGGYESMDQVRRDMGDARYGSDPAFRAKVEAKLARSNF